MMMMMMMMIDDYYHYHYNACDKDDTSSNNDNSNNGNDDDNVAGVDNVDDDVQSKLQFIRILGWETLVNSPHQVRLKKKRTFAFPVLGYLFSSLSFYSGFWLQYQYSIVNISHREKMQTAF